MWEDYYELEASLATVRSRSSLATELDPVSKPNQTNQPNKETNKNSWNASEVIRHR